MTNPPPVGPVSIGLAEIYALAIRAVDQGAQISAKLDLLAIRQDGLTQDVADHETRLRATEAVAQDVRGLPARVADLERNRWPAHLLSILIAAAALAAAIFIKR